MNRLVIDHDACFGCYACEVACKQENELPVGPNWIRVKTVGPREVDGKLTMDLVPLTCLHCSKPPCKAACPEGAIEQRPDGVVLIVQDRCTGCLACVPTCPYGALQYNERLGVVEKCHLCQQRLAQGRKPACAQACPAGAILYGDMTEIMEELRQRRANRLVGGRV